MAPEEKPYRVYKGGRTKGKVPAPSGSSPKRAKAGGEGRYRGPGAVRRGPSGRLAFLRRVSWRRWLPIGLGGLVALVLLWAIISYITMSSGVSAANKRLPADARAALTHQNGLLVSHATTILVLGTDNAPIAARAGDKHSDSIMLVRTDPSHHRISYLSIPRDLRVSIAGVGTEKINAAMQFGGPALAISTVHAFTGVADQPRDRRQLRRLQGPDRRARRDHGRRAGRRPLEPLRLPVRDRVAVPRLAGLAVPQRGRST